MSFLGASRMENDIRLICTAFVDAVVPFWGNYTVRASASAKTKFSTSV
jgi:hypothetical protein